MFSDEEPEGKVDSMDPLVSTVKLINGREDEVEGMTLFLHFTLIVSVLQLTFFCRNSRVLIFVNHLVLCMPGMKVFVFFPNKVLPNSLIIFWEQSVPCLSSHSFGNINMTGCPFILRGRIKTSPVQKCHTRMLNSNAFWQSISILQTYLIYSNTIKVSQLH